MFRPGSKNRVNAHIRALRFEVVTESAHKNSTSDFMLN